MTYPVDLTALAHTADQCFADAAEVWRQDKAEGKRLVDLGIHAIELYHGLMRGRAETNYIGDIVFPSLRTTRQAEALREAFYHAPEVDVPAVTMPAIDVLAADAPVIVQVVDTSVVTKPAKVLGRPLKRVVDWEEAARLWADTSNSVADLVKRLGVSEQTLYRRLKARGNLKGRPAAKAADKPNVSVEARVATPVRPVSVAMIVGKTGQGKQSEPRVAPVDKPVTPHTPGKPYTMGCMSGPDPYRETKLAQAARTTAGQV